MKSLAQATFAVTGWQEQTWDGRPYNEVKGEKLTRVEATYHYQGDLQGDSRVQYLMTYHPDGVTGSYVALERFEGTLNGRRGSFVLQHTGTFAAHTVTGAATVVPGSGRGELAGLKGEGPLVLEGQQPGYPFALEYEIE